MMKKMLFAMMCLAATAQCGAPNEVDAQAVDATKLAGEAQLGESAVKDATESTNRDRDLDTDVLCAGGRFEVGDWILSASGVYKVILQYDGNLVEYTPRGPIWDTGTAGIAVKSCNMQHDGNFVCYKHDGRPVWDTETYRYPGACLKLQDDGRLVIIYRGHTVWKNF